ncbi:hypothetical protein ACIA49_07070 [Kribbella sp. NPDC051587]|uniref:hypothetical protein n=1 Tax=Kribbella sp. NPDC051587 TaxID=3364119 RepID=UPI0037A74ABE
MTSTEVMLLRRSIMDRAVQEGFAADEVEIYEEELDRAAEKLTACLNALLDAELRVMIIPSLLHLSALGNPLQVRSLFEQQGIRVVLAQAVGSAT